jgi:acetyl-CoA carboxylase biotin carboxyl carrier protein
MEQKETKKVTTPKVVTSSEKATNKGNSVFNIDEINELLKAFTKSNVNELKLQKGDFKISINQGGGKTTYVQQAQPQQIVQQAAPVQAPPAEAAASNPSPAAAEAAPANNYFTIKSPMIGTFYRASGPGKPTFVNVGDDIKEGTVLCVVEAMKLFNEIESEISGKIVKVLIDDASPVEYDQPLFLVEPN